MIFKDDEIEELGKVAIYLDKREYSTDELWATNTLKEYIKKVSLLIVRY